MISSPIPCSAWTTIERPARFDPSQRGSRKRSKNTSPASCRHSCSGQARLEIAGEQIRVGQVPMGLGSRRVESQRFAVGGNGLRELTLRPEDVSQVVMGLGTTRAQIDRLPGPGKCLVIPFLLLQHGRQVQRRFLKFRVDLECAGVLVGRRFQPAHPIAGHAPFENQDRVPRRWAKPCASQSSDASKCPASRASTPSIRRREDRPGSRRAIAGR